MNNIKTSELPLGNLTPTSNTSNFLFVVVDLSAPIPTTSIVTETQIAQSIFVDNILNVGLNIEFADGSIQETAFSSDIYRQSNTAISDIANTNIALANMQTITYTKTEVDAAIALAITTALTSFADTLYV